MNKLPWTPWHQVVELLDDLKTGELSLSMFAADLYDVIMGRAKPLYQNPEKFFGRTSPTFNLRELVKDIVVRLAGKNDKAVRQLELTYGGGKTHTLITLLHLVRDPDSLPDLPAVKEFIEHAGMRPPKTRVAALAFDKLDVEKGMEISDPGGKKRWLKQPWSVLAWQIAGQEGLKLLHADGRDEERESAPAENLLTELLAIPGKQGLATLILIDEVLMYARGKVGLDPCWRGRLQDFFQYLTQATTKVDRCAMVASLLATDPARSDQLGKQITQELYAIFRREREEGVQPVVKEDVPEILRRQFFTPESIRDRERFRSHVVAALKGVAELDEQTKKDGKNAEERYLRSYPFHPDLTDVFYSKWTNLEGFQRTRGVLRTLTLALREAEKWDTCPLVAANVFLTTPTREGISESLRELTSVAASDEYEGKRQEWTGILDGELAKARVIQAEASGLKYRELEQAVIATFLHSQPSGQKALTNELMVLLGHTRPDKIELEKALQRWTEASWFLDEAVVSEIAAAGEGGKTLPKSWRLGSRPNLRQMHNDASTRVSPDLTEAKLLDAIGNLKSLTAGASAAGARVHNLPTKPNDIDDDGEFHYAVLGPKAASTPSNPSAEAKRFIGETTAPNRPRVYRNAVVLAVPSREGLDAARNCVRDYLGWEEVRSMLKGQEIDPLREGLLAAYLEGAKKKIPETIQQAYCIVVAVSDKDEIQAFKVTVGGDALFAVVKADSRSRIQESAISADALLPEGPYDLWREGETSRRVKDLVGAFAQFPHLPKMLRRQEIIATLIDGALQGFFVLRAIRPDRSVRTIWRQQPSDADVKDPSLEVVLPEAVTLADLAPELLVPGKLPGLWPNPPEIAVRDVLSYFSGGKVVKIPRNGYEETITAPKADRQAIELAISAGVEAGQLWLLSGPASILGEKIPAGGLTDAARLMPPPLAIPATDVLPQNLPEAWRGPETTALAISAALSQKVGTTLPWIVVKEAIDGAIRARYLETTLDSGQWPCQLSGAQTVKLRVAIGGPEPLPPPPPPPQPGVRVGEAELRPNELQDMAEVVGDLRAASVGLNLKLSMRIELSGDPPPSDATVAKINEVLSKVSKTLVLR
jgi:hypothetical protein